MTLCPHPAFLPPVYSINMVIDSMWWEISPRLLREHIGNKVSCRSCHILMIQERFRCRGRCHMSRWMAISWTNISFDQISIGCISSILYQRHLSYDRIFFFFRNKLSFQRAFIFFRIIVTCNCIFTSRQNIDNIIHVLPQFDNVLIEPPTNCMSHSNLQSITRSMSPDYYHGAQSDVGNREG